jgi:hypothetical protein
MHTVPLTPDLISACATLTRAAFADDELFEWLLPHRFRYPEHWQQSLVNRLHKRMNSPGIVVLVALSDQEDEWWDGSVGPEVLGYTVWERNGKGGQDQAVWGRDGLAKSECTVRLRVEKLLSAGDKTRNIGPYGLMDES